MFSNFDDDSMCRLCLESGACNPICTTLVTHRSTTMSCSRMVEHFVSFKIREDDGLPRHICSGCILKLETSYSFKKQCERSYNFLINYYNNKSSVDVKTEDPNLFDEGIDKDDSIEIEIKQIKDSPDDRNESSGIKIEWDLEKLKTPKEEQKCVKLRKNLRRHISDKKVKDDYDSVNTLKRSNISNESGKSESIIIAAASLYKNNDSENSSPSDLKDQSSKKPNKKISEKKHTSKPVQEKVIMIDKTEEILGVDINTLRTADKQYQCYLCPSKFKIKRYITRHLQRHLGIKSYFCEICQKHFSRKWDHMQTHNPKTKNIQCDYCDKKFVNKSTLNIHTLSHIEDRPFKCIDCEKSFKSTDRLAAHKKIHSAKKEFICQFCSKGFSFQKCLQIHIKSRHTNEKQYKCTLCEKRFVTNNRLKIHERRHLGIKNYHCKLCDKSFVSQANLITHSKMHSGEKPYECRVCLVKFKRTDHRNRHELTAHGVKFGRSELIN